MPQASEVLIRINHAAWSYAATKHAELVREGVDRAAVTWPAMPGGSAQGDLVERTREHAGDPPDFERAMVVHRRRVDVLAADCRREGHMKWFTPSRVWRKDTFDLGAELSPEQAARPRPDRYGPRAADLVPIRIVEADDEPPPSLWRRPERKARP